jgi:ABC-type polysaccharide/polyol phosphate export permease
MVKLLFFPFGVDIFCFGKKFLVYNLVGRNLITKYRRSILGILWTLASPLSMAIVYYFVFKIVLQVQQPYYIVLILGGVLPWTFFSQTIVEGTDSIVGGAGLLSKVPIPLPVFPFVGALTNLVTLFFSSPILIGAALLSGAPIGPSIIMLPFCYLILFLITYSISYTLGVASVYLRDLRHVTAIVMQVWFYATPVLYRQSMIPEKYRWILFVNPIGQIFAAFQTILTTGEWPDPITLGPSIIWAISLVTLVCLLHKYYFKEVVERI